MSIKATRVRPSNSTHHKAGAFIVGDVQRPEGNKLFVVAPWVEGAFSWRDGKKAYTLPKGGVDEADREQLTEALSEASRNAIYWQTAKREVKEETGIDIDRIRNPHDPHQTVPEEGFYEGVEIEQILQTPVFDDNLPSNRGNPAHHRMFLVKVKGIEALESFLKHAQNNHTGKIEVRYKALDVAGDQKLPDFDFLLKVLRSGLWGESVLFSPNKSVLLEKDPEERIKTPEALDALYQTLDYDERSAIKAQLNAIKSHMESLGYISDHDGLKLNCKHLPLRYYQEGADILPYEDWIARMLEFSHENEAYKNIQFNADYRDKEDGKYEYVPDAVSYAGMAMQVGARIEAVRALKPDGKAFAPTITCERLAHAVRVAEQEVRDARG